MQQMSIIVKQAGQHKRIGQPLTARELGGLEGVFPFADVFAIMAVPFDPKRLGDLIENLGGGTFCTFFCSYELQCDSSKGAIGSSWT